VGHNGVSVVGLMRHENDGGVGLGWDCEIEIRVAGARVIQTTEPDTRTVAFDGDVLVDQDRSTAAGKRLNDHRGVYGYVVVAEDGIAQGSCEFGDDLGAAMGRVSTSDKGDGSVGNEVTRKKNKIGCEAVDFVDDVFEEVGLSVFVEMDVTDLDDAVAIES